MKSVLELRSIEFGIKITLCTYNCIFLENFAAFQKVEASLFFAKKSRIRKKF